MPKYAKYLQFFLILLSVRFNVGGVMALSAAGVANEFLRLAQNDGESLTPMKLQKLVYFAHGWFLALTGEPLVAEKMEAWQFGPVIPQLYRQLKGYGNQPITDPISEFRMSNGKMQRWTPQIDETSETAIARQVIERVWKLYGGFTAVRLSNATHSQGSPWSQTYDEGSRSAVISNETIQNYFIGLARETDGSRQAS